MSSCCYSPAAVVKWSSVCSTIVGALKKISLFDLFVWKTQYSKRSLQQRLSAVPLFAVTTGSGSPYLTNSTTTSNNSVAILFVDAEEAQAHLHEVAQSAGAGVYTPNRSGPDVRLFAMGLDKGWNLVTASSSSAAGGDESVMSWKLRASSRQIDNATKPLHTTGEVGRREEWRYWVKIKRNFNCVGGGATGRGVMGSYRGQPQLVPLFWLRGLTIEKGYEQIHALYFDLEDLMRDWMALSGATDHGLGTADAWPVTVEVFDLLEILVHLSSSTATTNSTNNMTPTNNNTYRCCLSRVNLFLNNYFTKLLELSGNTKCAGVTDKRIGRWGLVASSRSSRLLDDTIRHAGIGRSRFS
eukprot:GHVS01006690.1.p1 GENE.GHVS01006690.1~~GHVS01006690.1.p1  ORF type:complete len:406 (-),score=69.80 GHVS01006690.1:242-1306(-)